MVTFRLTDLTFVVIKGELIQTGSRKAGTLYNVIK